MAALRFPRAGVDRIRLSPVGRRRRHPKHHQVLADGDDGDVGKNLFSPPERILTFTRTRDRRLERRSYRWIAQYRDRTASDAPTIDILYQPTAPYLPLFQVELRASMHRLLDWETILRLSEVIEGDLGGMMVREVEITADFPIDAVDHRTLRELAYFPRIGGCVHWGRAKAKQDCVDRTTSSVYGARESNRLARIYRKEEDGLSVTRVELRLCRDALKAIGVASPQSLVDVSWSEVMERAIKLLKFDPPAGALFQGVPADLDALVIRLRGLHAILRDATPERRRFLRRHLTPHAIGTQLVALVQSALDPHSVRHRAEHRDTGEPSLDFSDREALQDCVDGSR